MRSGLMPGANAVDDAQQGSTSLNESLIYSILLSSLLACCAKTVCGVAAYACLLTAELLARLPAKAEGQQRNQPNPKR